MFVLPLKLVRQELYLVYFQRIKNTHGSTAGAFLRAAGMHRTTRQAKFPHPSKAPTRAAFTPLLHHGAQCDKTKALERVTGKREYCAYFCAPGQKSPRSKPEEMLWKKSGKKTAPSGRLQVAVSCQPKKKGSE
jgi:hypothetical protein